MNDAITTGDDLYDYFFRCTKARETDASVFVSTKIRKEVLLNEKQGSITLNGKVRKIEFENMGGGVWKAAVPNLFNL